MRCIANVFLKQKAKCILKNVEILIQHEVVPFPKEMSEFEICIDKFYEDFLFGNRNITTALEEYTDIFQKYNVTSIVPKRMLLLIFENVVDYLDIIDKPDLFNWYYLVAKLILLNMIFEEYTNSITEKKLDYDKVISIFQEKNTVLFDDKIKSLYEKNYIKIIKNTVKNNEAAKKCLSELSKSPLKVKYDYIGKYENINFYISKVEFDLKTFNGIDVEHAFDAFQKYEFSNEFKYIEAENISFEVIKNVFSNKPYALYFMKLPFNFFRLKTNVSKLLNIIEPKTLNKFVFLIPYEEFFDKDVKIQEFKKNNVKLGVYDMKDIENRSIKVKNLVDYVYFKPSKVANSSKIIEFAKGINALAIEDNKGTFKLYK